MKVLVVAPVAGACGAGLWIVVAVLTDREVGWVAWAVGLAVGQALVSSGARGMRSALYAALIAFLSVMAGHVGVVSRVLETRRAELQRTTDAEMYSRLEAHAPMYLALYTEKDRDSFLAKHGYRLKHDEMRELMLIVGRRTTTYAFLRADILQLAYLLLGTTT